MTLLRNNPWAGAFSIFTFFLGSSINKRKSFLINTPKKEGNKIYEKYINKPIEITKRELFGKIFYIENLNNLVDEIVTQKKTNQYIDNEIVKFTEENFY